LISTAIVVAFPVLVGRQAASGFVDQLLLLRLWRL
jgi:hypothetical protein